MTINIYLFFIDYQYFTVSINLLLSKIVKNRYLQDFDRLVPISYGLVTRSLDCLLVDQARKKLRKGRGKAVYLQIKMLTVRLCLRQNRSQNIRIRPPRLVPLQPADGLVAVLELSIDVSQAI